MLAEVKDETNRAAIIEAAAQLFKKHGYNKIVMDDIARAVHKGRSTLYLYFKNKEELFDTILQNEMQDYFSEAEKELSAFDSAYDKLKAYYNFKFEYVHAQTNECLILTRELLEHPFIMEKVRRLSEPGETQLLEGIIRAGVERHEFIALSPPQIQLLARIAISAIQGVVNDFCLNDPSCAIGPVSELINLLFTHGLTLKPGSNKTQI